MHELFITAVLPDEHVGETLKILQGLCGMTPIHHTERFLTFEGPKANPLVGIGPAQMQGRSPVNGQLWRSLHEQLVRQSYYISVSYDVHKEQFGNILESSLSDNDISPGIDVEEAPGTLHFLDYPDPPGTKPANSRLAVHIKDEPRLPSLLRSLGYTYCSERIRETYNAYRENTVFSLSRDLRRPKSQSGTQSEGSPDIPRYLSAFEDFLPFDGENKWSLTALVEVSDEKQGALVQRGIDQLLQVKKDFDGIFEFTVANRRLLDTRVPAYLMSMRG